MEAPRESMVMGKSLGDRLKDARNRYYGDVASIIEGNPLKSYRLLMEEYGLTSWAIKRAIKLSGITRPCGQRSPAYRRGRSIGV